jgi:hypothetical protein
VGYVGTVTDITGVAGWGSNFQRKTYSQKR